jgi:hypothetical protein
MNVDGRHQTRGERWLCRHVFQHSLPSDIVEVVPRRAISGGYTPYGIINVDPQLWEDDYIGEDLYHPRRSDGKPVPLHKVHHYLHELAHCWQHFNGVMIVDAYRKAAKNARQVLRDQGLKRRDFKASDWGDQKFKAMYSYDITAGSDLLDFTMEQQCEIIADYYAMTLWHWTNPNSKHFGHLAPTQSQLAAVLTDFRKDPAYPRNASRMNELRARYRAKFAKV